MNGYLGDDTLPIPPGWDEWYGKLSEYDENLIGGSIYFNYRLREDPPLHRRRARAPAVIRPRPPGEPFTCFYDSQPENYQTDVVGDKAVDAIERLSGPGLAAEALLHGGQLQRAALSLRAGARATTARSPAARCRRSPA